MIEEDNYGGPRVRGAVVVDTPDESLQTTPQIRHTRYVGWGEIVVGRVINYDNVCISETLHQLLKISTL